MSRVGKIARLPRAIRDQLNHRLADAETGPRLVEWLNELPDVKKVLKADFGGRPITEQNLSEWRQGGFEDWLRHEDARAWTAQLVEEYDDLEKASGPVSLADRAALPAILALSGLIRQVLVASDPEAQRRTIISASQQLTNLRRACHQAEKLRLEKERWEAAQEKARQEAASRAEFLRLDTERLEIIRGEARRDAQMRAAVISDLPFDRVIFSEHPTKSDLIAPKIFRPSKTERGFPKPQKK